MDNPMQRVPDSMQRTEAPEFCRYCGARLDPAFYFCLSCATPYKQTESVLPRPLPQRLGEGELIAKKAPHVWGLFWSYMAVVVGTGVFCYVLFGEDRPELSLFFQAATLLVTTCIFAAVHWRSLLVQFRRVGLGRPAAWMGLAALVPLLAANYAYHGWVLRELGAEGDHWLNRLRQSGLGEGTLVFFICVFPAVIEEIAFRGLVQHWLQIAISPFRALVLASALFTALHFSILSAPYLFAVGMLLGWTKYKTASLYPCMLIHLIHNFVVLEFFWR